MIGLLVLGVLGAGLAGAILFDAFEDDPTEEEGVELEFDGEDILTGTDGDDTLSTAQDSSLSPSTIDLLDGDDTAEIDLPFGITVNGGAGDDVLSSTTVGNQLNGDEGDDTLYGNDGNFLYGGEGDDTITFDGDVYFHDAVARVEGGEGDDTINIIAHAGDDASQSDRGGVIAIGGEGEDTFNITLDLHNTLDDLSDGPDHVRAANLQDFDPSEDAIVIEVERDEDTQDRPVELAFEQNANSNAIDAAYLATVTLTFAATDNANEATATVTIYSDIEFTLGDIEFLGL